MNTITRVFPNGFVRGQNQGQGIIGEITESMHRFLLDGWQGQTAAPPRIEEDLSFIPKDREEVIYIYMYKVAQNDALKNSKRYREARVNPHAEGVIDGEEGFFERPPLYLDVHYLVGVHSKFRSDAERLLGWVLLRLHEATHLVYRPRRFTLPDGKVVDSMGRPWELDATGDELIMEKVALSLIDDMTVGDAINFFTIHEAPYRPYLTYRARCAMEGALVVAPRETIVRVPSLEPTPSATRPGERPNGRLGRVDTRPTSKRAPFGPEGHDFRPAKSDDNESED